MDTKIVNKVSESGLITLDLEQFLPQEPVTPIDLAPFLFMGQILREKDFRESMQQMDWSVFAGKDVTVFCSVDAILPNWAFMLVASSLEGHARTVRFGTPEAAERERTIESMREGLRGEDFADQRVVVKGCGDHSIGAFAYLEATRILRPHVKTLMYGEPCSTVPVYKRKP
jgi:hypothetical protein